MVNKVILIGNLGKDPEIRRFEGGSAVGKFTLATNESYKDKEGNWQDQTEWHDVVVWRDLADRAEKQLKKGFKVYVEGKLTHRKYTDPNGIDRYITEVVAATFRSLEKREGSGTGYIANSMPSADNEPATIRTAPPASNGGGSVSVEAPASTPMPAEGDDLPF